MNELEMESEMEEEMKRKIEKEEEKKERETNFLLKRPYTQIALPGKMKTPRKTTPRIHYGKE